MHSTTFRKAISTSSFLAILLAGAGLGSYGDQVAAAAPVAPHSLQGGVADVIVRIRGGAVCSGTPIAGGRLVVTAAHCVLDRDGNVARRTVIRNGRE